MEKGEYLACKTREAEIISLQMSLTKLKESPATLFPEEGDTSRSPAHPVPEGTLLCCARMTPSIAPPATRSWKMSFEMNLPFFLFGRVWGNLRGLVFFFLKFLSLLRAALHMARCMVEPAYGEEVEHNGTR